MRLEGVEIFAVGKWNGMNFTADDLKVIAAHWMELKTAHKVPLKFGHNNDQPMTDGYPALGWVTDVKVSGDKLVADFDHVPEAVYKAINSKLYNAVSIELDIDVQYKGKDFSYVLSGVALLGADLPAVNTLKDLSAYTNQTFSAFKKMSFSAIKHEVKAMTDSVTKAEFDALKDQLNKLVQQNAQFSTENATLKAEREANERKAKDAAFSAQKEKIVSSYNQLVKDGKITPAMRESFSKQINENTISFHEENVKTLSEGKSVFSTSNADNSSSEGKQTDSVDRVLLSKIQEIRLQNKCDFSTARSLVFKANPQMARDYVTMFDRGAA